MAKVYVGLGDYGLEGVDEEFVQFVFDMAVSMANLSTEAEAGLVITTDEHMRQLNSQYRGKDSSTNVLSFGYLETSPEGFVQPDDEHYLGDIYMSRTKIMEEAKEMGIADRERFLRLFVHGILHLSGRHHDTEEEASAMEALEDAVVDKVLE